MTCVWDGLIKGLGQPYTPHSLAVYLKKNNIDTVQVKWQGQKITEKQYQENKEWISTINEHGLHHGQDVSSFCPILFLVCQLFNVSIEHRYNGAVIKYEKEGASRVIIAYSNRHHFWT